MSAPTQSVLAHGHGGFPWESFAFVIGLPIVLTALLLLAGLFPARRTPAMWASGADPDHILSATERARVTSMGSMVVAIALSAVCSMTLALTLSFPGPWAWVRFLPVGLLWGLIVFSLDRWILSIVTVPQMEDGDEPVTGFIHSAVKVLLAVVRVLMSVLVGVVISEPIVMALFAGEISDQLNAMAGPVIKIRTAQIGATYAQKQQTIVNATQSAVTAAGLNVITKALALSAAQSDAAIKQKIYICEHQGAGNDPTCLALKAQKLVTGDPDPLGAEGGQTQTAFTDAQKANLASQTAQTALQTAQNKEQDAIQAQVNAGASLINEEKTDIATMTAAVNNNHGLLIREQALGALMKANKSVFWTRWAIFSALIVVDLMPLALKMLTSKTPYEAAAAAAVVEKVKYVRQAAEHKASKNAADEQHRANVRLAAVIRDREADDLVDAQIAEARRQERLRAALAGIFTTGDPTHPAPDGAGDGAPAADTPPGAGHPGATDGMLIGGRWLMLEPLRGVSHSTPFAPFLARDTLLEYPDHLVVKILAAVPAVGDDVRQLDNAFNEMTMPTGFIHKNLAEILDSGFDPRRGCFVVTNHYPHTLDGWLKNRELTLGDALELTRQLISGLAAAWERQYVHLDVKPANVGMTTELVIDSDGNVNDSVVKVFDFGLLQNWMYENGGHDTTAGHARYTPFYAPHEQLSRAKQWISRSADVWGIAATLYKMLTGRPPMWREADAVGLLDDNGHPLGDLEAKVDFVRLMRTHSPTPLDKLLPDVVPDYVAKLVQRWLSLDPAARNPASQQRSDQVDRFAPQMLALIDNLITRTKADGSYKHPVGGAHTIDVAVAGLDLSWREQTQHFPPPDAAPPQDNDSGDAPTGPGPVPPPHEGPADDRTRTEQ